MFKSTWTSPEFCSERSSIIRRADMDRRMMLHLQRLEAMRSTIDTSPPESLTSGLRRNVKLELLQQERHDEIMRDNRTLIEHLGLIGSRESPYVQKDLKYPISHSYIVRRRAAKRIHAENLALIERMIKTKSSYERDDLAPKLALHGGSLATAGRSRDPRPPHSARSHRSPRAAASSSSQKPRAASASPRARRLLEQDSLVTDSLATASVITSATPAPQRPPNNRPRSSPAGSTTAAAAAERPPAPVVVAAAPVPQIKWDTSNAPPAAGSSVASPEDASVSLASSRLPRGSTAGARPRKPRILEIEGMAKTLSPDMRDRPILLYRTGLKYEGEYCLATVLRAARNAEMLLVTFYFPEKITTYTTALTVDAAAQWLKINPALLRATQFRVSNRISPEQAQDIRKSEAKRAAKYWDMLIYCFRLAERKSSNMTPPHSPLSEKRSLAGASADGTASVADTAAGSEIVDGPQAPAARHTQTNDYDLVLDVPPKPIGRRGSLLDESAKTKLKDLREGATAGQSATAQPFAEPPAPAPVDERRMSAHIAASARAAAELALQAAEGATNRTTTPDALPEIEAPPTSPTRGDVVAAPEALAPRFPE